MGAMQQTQAKAADVVVETMTVVIAKREQVSSALMCVDYNTDLRLTAHHLEPLGGNPRFLAQRG